MSDLPEGVCLKCKKPMFVHTASVNGRLRPFCPGCEKELNEKISKSLASRGKTFTNGQLIFPPAQEGADA